jgi:ABC-type amino acid transport substrate-binding protein
LNRVTVNYQNRSWKSRFGYLGLQGVGIISLMLLPTAYPAQSPERVSHTISPETAVEAVVNPEQLTVGIGGTPPFLIRQGDNFQGIVSDVWEQIALINNYEYELILQTDTQEALDAVANGELDLLVGPFSITASRLERVNFTQPFFVSSVGVVLPQESPTLWSRVRPFFTAAALSSVGALTVCLFLVGNGMWLAERQHNPEQFPPDYIHGVGNGMWFALVTLTTVGYGDRAPSTPAGRVIAGTWMLISLIAVSSLIGGLASAFTLALSEIPTDSISSPEDLQGTRMAVVEGTTGEKWGAEYRAKLLPQSSLKDAITLVLEGNADGAIFDRPALEYYLSQYPEVELRLAEFVLNSENFGFVLPQDSDLALSLDQVIVRLKEEGIIGDITEDWLRGVETGDVD